MSEYPIHKIVSQITYNLKVYTERVALNLSRNYYTKGEIDVMDVKTWHVIIVNSLPSRGDNEHLYLKPSNGPDTSKGVMDEYLWVNNKFEKIGQVNYDMRNYNTAAEIQVELDKKADNIHGGIPHRTSDLDNDLNFAYLLKKVNGIVIGDDAVEDITGTPDVVRQAYMDAHYYTKANSISKEEFEDNIDAITARIEALTLNN